MKPTAKPTPTPKPTKSVPKTGGGVPMAFWGTLNVSSLAGLGGVTAAQVREKRRARGKRRKK